ncbi:MAG TPA: DsbE family thiol:disulfide interchange protein [Pyrinomonadaceae bacterium]|nr:DsbE family thiol:disulfide interchange protein [Pyrinomonadaceae bacterium]
MTRYVIPLGIFVVLVAFLAIGLGRDPRKVPSPLIDKPAPDFQLTQLHDPSRTFSAAEMRGKVWLLNVWASWCISCREEHPLFLKLARSGEVPVYGLNYKDKREEALRWLQEFRDPYILSVADTEGRVGIDYGVYAVPETFLIDREGFIRFKHIGPVTAGVINDKILPLVRELNR